MFALVVRKILRVEVDAIGGERELLDLGEDKVDGGLLGGVEYERSLVRRFGDGSVYAVSFDALGGDLESLLLDGVIEFFELFLRFVVDGNAKRLDLEHGVVEGKLGGEQGVKACLCIINGFLGCGYMACRALTLSGSISCPSTRLGSKGIEVGMLC